jgi:hypothetical protein
MDLEIVANIIFAFCMTNAKHEVNNKMENQRICHEAIVNCTVDLNGVVTKAKLDSCTNKYKSVK